MAQVQVPAIEPMSPRPVGALVRMPAELVRSPVPTVRVRMKEAGDLMSEQSQHIHFENTNRWSTKQLVTMALMCALGALFMYVQLPILPSAPF